MNSQSAMGDEYLPIMTIADAAKYTGLPELAVRRLAREGAIPALKLGRQWRIKRDLLTKWLETHPLPDVGKPEQPK